MAKPSRKVLPAATAVVAGRVFEFVGAESIDPKLLKLATEAGQPFYDPAHRHDLPFSPDLLASILERGVVNAVPVAVDDDGTLWIIDGRQRVRHAVAAGKTLVPIAKYKVAGYTKTDVERLIMELNRTVQGVSDLESSKIARKWIDEGLSKEEAARSMGVTASKFDAFLALSAASDVVKEAVADNTISLSAAAIIANESPEDAAKIIDRAVEIRQEINAANPGKAGKLEAKVSNLDLRTAKAEADGKALPASAARKTDAPKPEKARTGAYNADEIGAFVKALEAAFQSHATDKEVGPVLVAVTQVLNACKSGSVDAFTARNKAADVVREAFASVRVAPAANEAK